MANTTPSEAIANVIERVHTTSSNYPTNVGIKHYNKVYKKVLSKMRLLDDEYFWEELTFTTVIGQREYTIKDFVWDDTITREITRIKRAYIKYSADDQYFLPVREENPAMLTYWKDYYETWTKTDPFYYIQDNSVWIFPVSTEAVTLWGRFEAIINPPSLLSSDAADKVKVPERINEVIEDWMIPFVLEYLWKITYVECMRLFNEFISTTLRDSINDLAVRGDWYVVQDTSIQSQFR